MPGLMLLFAAAELHVSQLQQESAKDASQVLTCDDDFRAKMKTVEKGILGEEKIQVQQVPECWALTCVCAEG